MNTLCTDAWNELCSKYEERLRVNPILEEHLEKIEELLFSDSLEQTQSGCSLLFALAPEYLCRYVQWHQGRLSLRDDHRYSNPLWMERAVVMEVRSCAEFALLVEHGAFQAMTIHALDLPLKDLSVADRTFALSQSKAMRLLSGGEFMMGALAEDDQAQAHEYPRHTVVLEDEIWVARFQVTQILWWHVTGHCLSPDLGVFHPVETVNWFDCLAFCNLLSEKEGLEPVYAGLNGYQIGQECTAFTGMDLAESITANHQASGYRLLTEAEWEYAAQGGEMCLFAGGHDSGLVAWGKDDEINGVQPVGQKQANGFGLYDMSGNVWEWCWDWSQRPYMGQTVRSPKGPRNGGFRTCRGGSWKSRPRSMRVSGRFAMDPTTRGSYGVGFRICRTEEYL
jgi:formylglycine-generating enzyme required for sulfatase activity